MKHLPLSNSSESGDFRKEPRLKTVRAILQQQKLKFACLLIVLCFLLANDQYQAKVFAQKSKKLFPQTKIVDYRDVMRGRSLISKLYQPPTNNFIGNSLLTKKAIPLAGGDTCANGTNITALPYNDTGTTVGRVDDYDLPADTVSPTVTGCPTCTATGGGPSGSQPRGGVYTGTGTGPDATYRICFTSSNNQMTVTMDPTGTQDLALIVYTNVCSSNLADAIVVDDDSVGGAAESVTISTMPAGTYNIVVDGYSTGGTAPGPSGPYTLNVTTTGTPTFCPVTAATVTAGGRIVNSQGNGIAKARVSVINSEGETKTAVTNPFGYYRFDELPSGQNYIFQVTSKQYQFAESTQTLFITSNLDNVNFIALPQE